MRNSLDPNLRFVWDRIAFFPLAAEDEAALATSNQRLNAKVARRPVESRSKPRIEAEDFTELSNYELEITGNTASHRICVKLSDGKAAGRVRADFKMPCTSPQASYDIEDRFFDEQGQRSQFDLSVTCKSAARGWRSAGAGTGWTTHTISDVQIKEGDQINLEINGPPGRFDYVQLNIRSRSFGFPPVHLSPVIQTPYGETLSP